MELLTDSGSLATATTDKLLWDSIKDAQSSGDLQWRGTRETSRLMVTLFSILPGPGLHKGIQGKLKR
jgi:hypothetical protein